MRIRRWLPAACIALAVAVGGCSDATPAEEVSAGSRGRGSSPPASASDPAVPAPTTVVEDGAGSGGSDGSGGSRPGSGGEPGAGGGSEPTSPAPGGGSTAPGAQPGDEAFPPLTTVPGDRRHAQQWDSYTVAADDRTLTFLYYAGVAPCSVFDSIVADEGATSVRVTIYERSGPDGVACIMLAQEKSASITLGAPLAGRAVV